MSIENYEEWVQWCKVNLQRGCCVEEMVQLICKEGVPLNYVKELLGDDYPDHLDFNLLATVAITRNPKVKKIDTDKAQIFWVPHFMIPSECEQVISIIDSKLRPSEVTASNGDDLFRTSSTCYLEEQSHPFINVLDMRIAQTMGLPSFNSEPIQGQKYDIGQEFKAHTDFFNAGESDYGRYTTPLGQRTWSFMVYLNTTPKGGETFFEKLDMEFSPQQGCALVWNNLNTLGFGNSSTLHHAKPVLEGCKYVITKWFRTRSFE
ncbi:hypothetical protein PSECIP111951_03215 [Pseudoalteromonas holothuriae]|uniref:Fe2OG dioxygenase domain-containing protein n=1 Tax=Pseudoalteromonas holothuriae TaxID=2963714 RepID=A0ABM9GLB1_9GAMM|nr:2OG-Fe(II) oxygenase [Pseudoalteromonas sp. CIP111951]CAH9064771.1 hypothetical protein PSECIP111951_03215 [Pseudoalteromonas sp. CIP111951]